MGSKAHEDDSERETVELSVPEMDCSSCATTIGAALDELEGVHEYQLQPTSGQVRVTGSCSTQAIVNTIEETGYDVADGPALPSTPSIWSRQRTRVTVGSGTLLALGAITAWLGVSVARVPLGPMLLFGAILLGGSTILPGGVRSARRLSLDMDLLMSVAILGATAVSIVADHHLLIEAASLAVLFNVAEVLERHAVDRARSAVGSLVALSPETALVEREGARKEVPVESVALGETVIVEPGSKIPVDGEVRKGQSAVDESPVTGESVPVDKTEGDEVYAGTITQDGYLEIRTTAAAGESTLANVIELVRAAESRPADRQQYVDRFASIYTPVVVGAAVAVAIGPPLLFGAPAVEWLVRGIGLLVIACPCAFVISTPVTVVSGLTSAARNGVLVKGGDHLESMGEADVVAFDKTGTLTSGDLQVTDVIPLNGHSEASVLACARGVERRSEHPIASAIVDEAEAVEHPPAGHGGPVQEFERLGGLGVRATLNGTTHYAGNPALFEELGFDLEHVHVTDGALPPGVREQCERENCLDLVTDTIPRLQAEGKTVVLVGDETQVEGILAVADTLRPEAAEAVEALREQGLRTVMLTGDNERTARAVASAVGVDDFHADLLPAEKVDAVEAIEHGDETVAMVGDGVNDAPALAAATVGVAMGAAGSDAAIETADVALLGDDLSRLPYLHTLASSANGVVRQNIWASLAVKAVLGIGIPLGAVSLVVAVLAGDVGMTTLVTGNAMRLSRLDPDSTG